MLTVEKKKRRHSPRARLWLLLILAAALALTWAAAAWLSRPEEEPEEPFAHITSGELARYEAKDVRSVTITLKSESWTILQDETGQLTLEGEDDFLIDAGRTADLLEALRVIAYEDVLSEDPVEYAGRLEEFGLAQPLVIADVCFADGARWVIRVGDLISHDEGKNYYMLLDGDDRLFALDKGTAENLMLEKNLLHPVEQPVLHKARFDRITFTDGQGGVLAQWTLEGGIGGNAQDRWFLTAPVRYPADGEALAGLQENLAGIRLGAYVGEATEKNLRAYGFDAPRFCVEIHQAAGTVGTVSDGGVYAATDWPENTFTLTVGGAKNDSVDYVLVGESIYISSHFLLDVFMTTQPLATISRYTVPVALGNLQSLTIRTGGGEDVYTITRTEQVAANNDLVTDAQGNLVYDLGCLRNGEPIPYAGFESAYNDLLKVSVSGSLPQGWKPWQEPHTTFIFQAVSGESYTLGLTAFDAMHDAVLLEGEALFYLIRDGMILKLE